MTTAADYQGRIKEIQDALESTQGLDGWLFYDFRGSDPLAYRVLRLDPTRHVTRRWYYFVPRSGRPMKLLHRIEPHALDELPGDVMLYVSWQEQRSALTKLLTGVKRVAMQYSPMNAVPYVSRVDAGTIELVRSLDVEVATSADLVQQFEAVMDERQLTSHREATEALRRIVDETFAHIGDHVTRTQPLTEHDIQQFILGRIRAYGLTTSTPPIAALNAHSADPHYSPTSQNSTSISRGDLVLIDLWAKRPEPGSVYGDITWTGFVGNAAPPRQAEIFGIVRAARDAALKFVQARVQANDFPCGWEVDEVCRNVIREAGYAAHFLHRTGHSIGEEVHGNGANIDNLETQDGRRLMPRTCFSIEPGIYLPGEFGIRSELDVYVSQRETVVFGQPLQSEIVPIL
ncbi:MAG TPA: M24 family metallopeptidase [Nitrospiraceae bacterium]|jgi:Xaa-Pro aminopeptidase|nr:M24 family metallopeptidase [Nitrospiraceae bacterium]